MNYVWQESVLSVVKVNDIAIYYSLHHYKPIVEIQGIKVDIYSVEVSVCS